MRLIYTTICIITLVMLSCDGTVTTPTETEAPDLTPENSYECAWTEPVRIAGAGIGTIEFIAIVDPVDYDLCDCVPLDCEFSIVGLNLLVCEFKANGEMLPNVWVHPLGSSECVITFLFTFPDPLEDYAVGDTWRFGLE